MEGKANGMKVYLSGKISGLRPFEAMENFVDAKDFVHGNFLGCGMKDIINPLDIKPLFGIKKYWFFMAADLWQLRKCDTIAMQPNWIDSKGAVIEFFVAKFILKLKVIYL